MQKYVGTIIEESLMDNRVLNGLKIISFRISGDERPSDRWHLYKVEIAEDDIEKLSQYIKQGTWYMHFWDEDKNVIAVFKDKIFRFKYNDKKTWEEAVMYGLSLGIPVEQLDFVIE